MRILAIESSCDETAAAVLKTGGGFPDAPDFQLLSNVVVSQIDIFKEYGGVIPEVAARSHLEAILPVVHKALEDAGCGWGDIDAIAVTHTPGLLGSLLIGTLTARTLAILHDKPLYPVHHLKSHIYSALLTDKVAASALSASRSSQGSDGGGHPTPAARGALVSHRADALNSAESAEAATLSGSIFPALALVVSGGHTQIIYMRSHSEFEIVATTRDDAVGECFDKVAKILGLPYPGGPAISAAAKSGDPHKYKFPHPVLKNPDGSRSLDFSFSGLKTAVLREVQKDCGLPLNHPSHDLKNHLTEQQVADFAASFQQTAVDILLENLVKVAEIYPCESVILAGGVSANALLKEQAAARFGDKMLAPLVKFAGDNAAMVALAAAYEISTGAQPADPYHLDILPRSDIR